MKIDASDFLPIVPQCVGCAKVEPQDLPETKPVEIPDVPQTEAPVMPTPTLEIPETRRCRTYISPASKWNHGRTCGVATHIVKEETKVEKQLNSIKASKRSMGVGGKKK